MGNKIGINHTFDSGDGRTITIETGKLAAQAHGSVVVRQGDCMLLATVVASSELKEGQDFFPLSVDYQEKFASAGRIPGGFFKRERQLSEYEILICRIVDRVLRPLFNEDYLCDTQVMIQMISSDPTIAPDSLAALAASAALSVSDIPFNGPISEVRVCKIDGKFVVNPLRADIERAELDILVGASATSVVMVEGEAKEVSEADFLEAIKIGHEAVKLHCKAQLELRAKVGITTIREYQKPAVDEDLKKKIYDEYRTEVYAVAASGVSKDKRKVGFTAIKDKIKAQYAEAEVGQLKLAKKYYSELEYDVMRDMILDDSKRLDGRKMDEIRPIWIEPDYIPSAHGSAVFTRGETQSLTTVTLGTKLDEQMLDKAMEMLYSKFMLHYNFPGFSTGEVKPNRGTSRREVGHGNLAMRSLKNQLPQGEENPYTIRVVSDILESNGSSSMATVCAGSIALHDAGVKMKNHVSGIAMGLITGANGKFAVLSDILGDEDHLGDMDFKVTGTKNGICGCQMDIKVQGLSFEIMAKALEQARQGRLHILNLMYEAQPAAREDLKPFTPRMVKLYVPQEMIGPIIGPGGKNIQELQRSTGTIVTIEDKDGRGEVVISSTNKEGLDAAVARIKGLTTLPEVGAIYEGKIKSIKEFGAFVEILPGKEGLLHISEVSHKRLDSLDGVLKVGEMVKVKLLDIDAKTGKYKLSRKVLLEKTEGAARN